MRSPQHSLRSHSIDSRRCPLITINPQKRVLGEGRQQYETTDSREAELWELGFSAACLHAGCSGLIVLGFAILIPFLVAIAALFLWKQLYGTPDELVETVRSWGIKEVKFIDTNKSAFIPKASKLPFMPGTLGMIAGEK